MSTQEVLPELRGGDTQALATRTPMQLMELAIQRGVDADTISKLMDLQLRWDAEQQRKAYIEAMAIFRANPPDINKTREVRFNNKDGRETVYHHAELDQVTEVISAALGKVDIRPSWKTSDVSGKITVTCVLTHKQGHSEEVATLQGPPDVSGGKNNIQAIGSTVTYLQRYTLLAGTGLAPKGIDDDGKTEGMAADAVHDYVTSIEDSTDVTELQQKFTAAYKAAKKINDKQSMDLFINVKDERKRVLR